MGNYLVPLALALGLLLWWLLPRLRVGVAGHQRHRALLAQDAHYRRLNEMAEQELAAGEPSGFFEEQRQLHLLSDLADSGFLTERQYDRAARKVEAKCGGPEE